MNKRQFKKLKNKQFFNILKQINENDALIFEFDMNNIHPDSLSTFAKQITSMLDNKVIFIPKDNITLKYNTELKNLFIQQLLAEVNRLSGDMSEEEFNRAVLEFLEGVK